MNAYQLCLLPIYLQKELWVLKFVDQINLIFVSGIFCLIVSDSFD